jgi:hypothetical protein
MKIKCVKIPCQQDSILGTCQCFYNLSGELKYARIRHYDKVVSGKPKFTYHAQTLSYVFQQLEKLNQQNLSSSKESNTVAAKSVEANCDQVGHDTNIDHLSRELSSKLETSRCRGSLAWLGRQTHNLEFARAKRPQPEVAGSNPVPGTTFPVYAF